MLLKYWFSVSDEEQEARFRYRIDDPTRRWKLIPMDLESRHRWVEFSRAKDEMFAHTNIPEAPWFTVEADYKRRARLNCIRHLLSKVSYVDMTPAAIELPPRKGGGDYRRPPSTNSFLFPITTVRSSCTSTGASLLSAAGRCAASWGRRRLCGVALPGNSIGMGAADGALTQTAGAAGQ